MNNSGTHRRQMNISKLEFILIDRSSSFKQINAETVQHFNWIESPRMFGPDAINLRDFDVSQT